MKKTVRCCHSRPEWTWEQWQWCVAPHSPKLQPQWNFTIRLFSVIIRILLGAGSLTLLQRCSRSILQPQPTGQIIVWSCLSVSVSVFLSLIIFTSFFLSFSGCITFWPCLSVALSLSLSLSLLSYLPLSLCLSFFLSFSGCITVWSCLSLPSWRNVYRCRKQTLWAEFKSWIRLFALIKVRIQLFSFQLWVNSWIDLALETCYGNHYRRRKSLNSNLSNTS